MIRWATVVGFPDYAVSDRGDVVRVVADLRNHALTNVPLIPHVSPSGYASVSLCANARKKGLRVNRIVCEAFHGPPPSPKHHAAHANGIRLDNRADNLSWLLPVDNEADKVRHGTNGAGERHWSVLQPEKRAKGSGHGLAKLTESDIPLIRKDGRSFRAIAKDYGVHWTSIKNVKTGRTWSHV